jgi:4-amino-4-deoxy-L-arabinose transferase-like glycosyltransferase
MSRAHRLLPAAACAGLVASAIVVGLLTFDDYGVTWDEGVQARYGELAVAYFESGLEDRRVDEFLNLRHYGPLFETAAAFAYRNARERRHEIRHLAIASTGLLALLATMACARALGSRWLPALAGLALLSQPRFYGHLFNNSKDVPFAATFAITMAILMALLVRPEPRWWKTAAAGLAIGVCAATRPGGLPLLAFFLLLALAGAAWLRAPAGRLRGVDLRQVGLHTAAALVLAWGLLVAVWPSAHPHPLTHPVESIAKAAAFTDVYPVLFEGRSFASTELPSRYLPRFLSISTPPLLLVLAAIGLIGSLREWWRGPRQPRTLVAGLIALWVVVPLGSYVLLRPNVYDGIRHFLFVLPGLALLGALGVRSLVGTAPRGPARALAAVALVAGLCWPIRSMAELHPYQSSYFNSFAGGLAGAEGHYETDYWASSYKEGMAWIRERAAERPDRPLRVLVAATPHSREAAASYAGSAVELSFTFRGDLPGKLPDSYDYYLATTRWRKHQNFPQAPIVHSIGRQGAVFSVIRGH